MHTRILFYIYVYSLKWVDHCLLQTEQSNTFSGSFQLYIQNIFNFIGIGMWLDITML